MLPDPDFYAECIYSAYEDLYAATQEKPAPRLRHRSHTKTGETTPTPKAAKLKRPSKAKKAKKSKKGSTSSKAAKATKAKKSAAVAASDDLKLIKGVGPALEKKLNVAGIQSFSDIAALKAADIKTLDESLDLKGRVKRDGWVKQAKALASG
ncbi:UNVERIFIED_CONTAM: hypothetical protein GTU68_042231 [Idotea baltica]|nr:hypothetical protein [Idotea baltica]